MKKAEKKYKVENIVGTPEMMAGSEPWTTISDMYVDDYITAETPEQAIAIAIDFLADRIIQLNCVDTENDWEFDVDIDAEELTVLKNREIYEIYTNFTAKEV